MPDLFIRVYHCARVCAAGEAVARAVHVGAVQDAVAHALHRLRAKRAAGPHGRLAHHDLYAHRRHLYARALLLAHSFCILLMASSSSLPTGSMSVD